MSAYPRPRLWRVLFVIVAVSGPGSVTRANPALQGYLNHESLTQRLVELDQSELVTLQSIGKSHGGRNIWLLTVGPGTGPAIAVVGNLQSGHLAGGEICLRMAQRLVALSATDETVRKLLSERTFYFLPRPDPDGCEKSFVGPWRLPAGNGRRTDDDRDFQFGEDPPEDLDGDGWITSMRVEDETGSHIPLPEDPRLMIVADRNKNERGTHRILVEGVDNDGDESWNEDAGDGVALDRNFPFRYQPFEAHHGPNAVSEPESRAIADFFHDRTNIALVLSFSTEENLLHPWKPNPDRERQRIKTSILGADAPALEYISNDYKQKLGSSEGPGGTDSQGTFASWIYFHLGKWSLSARGWSIPKVELGADEKPPNDKRGADEWNALRWYGKQERDGFSAWKSVDHPDFPNRKVEVGGFRPFFLLNPPADQLDGIAEKHTQFLLGLPTLMARSAIAEKRVEVLGGNVVRITAKSVNRGFLATMPEMGQVNGQPIQLQIELRAPAETVFLRGSPRQRVPRLSGNGGNQETHWLIRLPNSEPVKMSIELTAPTVDTSRAEIEIKPPS